MANRILRDIRFYESNSINVEGHYPGELGNSFNQTSNTKYIGQRIARKLNELKFISGEFDHIFINLTTVLDKNKILISKRFIDKRIQYIDYGVEPNEFNSLNDIEKDLFTTEIVFKSLMKLYETDNQNLVFIKDVKLLIDIFKDQIIIAYKTKETKDYKIEIGYKIKPDKKSNFSKMTIDYVDKKENIKFIDFIDLYYYEDIYSLVETITLSKGQIILSPKKSFKAEFTMKQYKTPLRIEIKEMTKK